MYIAADKLTIGYDFPLLSNLSFEVRRGETVALVGKSGCGKTTLLKTLAGIVPKISGDVTVLGFDPSDHPNRGRIGYIPQNLGLIGNASVLMNVLMGCATKLGTWKSVIGTFPEELVKDARGALKTVGLEGNENVKPAVLSGGEQRRVAIARALVQSPDILLADEILADLDHNTCETVLKVLKKMQEKTGMAILLVEHNLNMACDVSARILGLSNGTITKTFTKGQTEKLREVLYG